MVWCPRLFAQQHFVGLHDLTVGNQAIKIEPRRQPNPIKPAPRIFRHVKIAYRGGYLLTESIVYLQAHPTSLADSICNVVAGLNGLG